MAGMTLSRPRGTAPPGTVWSDQYGGYVAQDTGLKDTAEKAALTTPQYTTSPLGEVSQFNYGTGNWDTKGYVPGTQMTADGFGLAGAGGGSTAKATSGGNDAAIKALMEEVRNTHSTYTPAQVPVTTSGATGGSPYDLAGEQAAYGAAKERTGLALQSAMRGLQAQLSQRGITGSGIEADKIGELYGRGVSELGATDRQLAEQRAGRAFSAGQSDTDRTIGQNTYNVGAQNDAARFAAEDEQRRLEMVARLGALLY